MGFFRSLRLREERRRVVLTVRLLLDTHIVLRWLIEPRRLSREQLRVIRDSVRRREPLGLSAVTLIEIANLAGEGPRRINLPAVEFLAQFEDNELFEVLPVTVQIAQEMAAVGSSLRDPMDWAIVCTARVHKLRLVTSDERIANSGLIPVVT